jgi:excisionase family DNA binding protein
MPTTTTEGEILTIKEVAEYLKVTDRTIYRLAGAKKIPAFKVGGTWRFSRADIDEWIRRQSTEGVAEPLGDSQGDDQSGGSAGNPG